MAEPTLNDLAAFQVALLELLSADLPLEQVQARLGADPVFQPFEEYLGQVEPRMLETAAILVKKWGRRRGEAGDPLAER
jgi:hypothetical protein